VAGEDRPRLLWTKTLPCFAPGAPAGCSTVVEANHGTGVRERGGSQKAHDDTAWPLCSQHHADWGHNSGPFKGWCQAQRRGFEEWAIATVRSWWDRRRPLPDWF
jgi:hypothetical protein